MRNRLFALLIATTILLNYTFAEGTGALVSQENSYKNDIINYTVVKKPSIAIIGIECKTSNSPEAAPQDIPKHWGKFYSENVFDQIPNKNSNDVIALYCDYDGDYTKTYSLVIGCAVNSLEMIPEGMVAKIIPEGAYAIFNAIGKHPEALVETWRAIWNESTLKRTYTGDYEYYGDKFSIGSTQEVDVFIAIEDSAD